MALTETELQKYLDGLEYPATRQKVLDHALAEGAPEHVISTLNRFPERIYESYEDLEAAFYSTLPVQIESEGETMPRM